MVLHHRHRVHGEESELVLAVRMAVRLECDPNQSRQHQHATAGSAPPSSLQRDVGHYGILDRWHLFKLYRCAICIHLNARARSSQLLFGNHHNGDKCRVESTKSEVTHCDPRIGFSPTLL